MLIIRPEQIAALEAAASKRLQNSMAEHLREMAPQHCSAVGETNLAMVVETGIARAADYGLTFRGPVRFYLDLMIMFGSDFDTDPQYPWASELLSSRTPPDQMERAERLYESAMLYSATVFGPDYSYEKAAVRRAGTLSFEQLPSTTTGSVQDFIGQLTEAYPEKAQFIGEEPLIALINKAQAGTKDCRLDEARGLAVVTGLMFAFGHGALADPQFHWIAKTLANDSLSPLGRTERLFRRALTYQSLGQGLQK